MAMFVIKTPVQKTHYAIKGTMVGLEDLPKVTVTFTGNKELPAEKIQIKHSQVYFPDFEFIWDKNKDHYRVYIFIAYTTYEKRNAGYCICTIGSRFAAYGFATLYGFLHKHRADNKEAAIN